MCPKQKDVFLSSEGDAWLKRNQSALGEKKYSDDLVVIELKKILSNNVLSVGGTLLEIGCGNGSRLEYLKKMFKLDVKGVDPSGEAVRFASKLGVDAKVGTADKLEYPSKTFDIIVFGFCLYLCDREDLFRIAYEADRVLKNSGFIIVLDFFSQNKNNENEYSHHPGIRSNKMDYRELFLWSPLYECYRHKVIHHENHSFTDNKNEWISISTIRKYEKQLSL